jgi:chromosome segregation ATPase
MTDQNDPVQQEPTENPTESSQQSPVQQVEDWERRYKGSVKKIEELTLSKRDLEAQLAEKASRLEQLDSQLGIKDVEKDTALRERDKKLEELLQSKSQADQELETLRAMQLKLEVIKELRQPKLIEIVDKIPNLTDKEALTTVMKDFASWGNSLAKEREDQILAGYTPPVSASTSTSKPTTHSGWMEYVNNLPMGSDERNTAMDEYWAWGQDNP